MSEQKFIVTHEKWNDYVFIGNQGECEGEIYSLINADEEGVPEQLQVWKAVLTKFELCVKIDLKTGE